MHFSSIYMKSNEIVKLIFTKLKVIFLNLFNTMIKPINHFQSIT